MKNNCYGEELNVLFLSAGTRNKLIEYFKESLGQRGRVIAADLSIYAPALYAADGYYITSAIGSQGYLDQLIDICEKENISLIISLIDPELSFLARHRHIFEDKGIELLLSDLKTVDICFDKYKFYQHLASQGIPTVLTYINLGDFYRGLEDGQIDFPVFVKPRWGSASIDIQRVDGLKELEAILAHDLEGSMIIQEFMSGQECGVDCYIDMISGELIASFSKRKILMRSGETDKSISFKDKRLDELINRLHRAFDFKGVIDVDLFYQDGKYYVSEVNPRFGGGYPHAYASGVNFFDLIIENLQGRANKPGEMDYEEGIVMMKYLELVIKKHKGSQEILY